MNYFKKEIAVFVATLIAIVCLVYMDKIWAALSWDAETFIAVSAIASVAIAIIALWVSMRADKRNERQAELLSQQNQTQAVLSDMRREKQARLSVKPFLITVEFAELIDDGMIHVVFNLANRGVGPAIIKNFVLLYEGNEVVRNKHQVFHHFMKEKLEDFTNARGGNLIQGSAIKDGDKQMLWEFTYDPKTQNTDNVYKLGLLIEYQSIYEDEVFTYRSSIRK